MEVKSNNIILSILFISLMSLVNSQNIITSWHYDKVQMFDLETLSDLFANEDIKKITINDFTENSINIKNLKITEFTHSLYDSYLNYKTGLFLLTPDKISFSFTFDYEYNNIKSNATFDFKLNLIKIKIKNNKEAQTQSVNINGEYSDTDFSVYDINDKFLNEKVKYSIYKGFKRLNIVNNDILGKIDLITHYKNKLAKKKDFILTTSSLLDKKKIVVNLNRFLAFCEDVKGTIERTICYYSGEIDNQEDKTDRSKVPLSNNDFMNSTDTYDIFININLLNKIIEKILSEGISEKNYDKTIPRKSLPYDFTLSSLKKYFNGLDSYEDSLEFTTKIKITKFDTGSVIFNIKFNLGEQTDVFSLDVELNFKLDFSLKKNVRLNLCLNNIDDMKVKISSGSMTIKNENELISAIKESFDFENYPICLSDNGVSFKDYYTKITKIQKSDEGYYLFGNQLYQ